MTAGDSALAALLPKGGPARIVARRTAITAARSGVLWGYAFGLTVASAALGFSSTYKTPHERAQFAALFGSNAGLAALNGPAVHIQSVAGYTVWKSLMFLAIVGAVWGLLTATRLLRGEEDAGRWELLLAGRTTRRGSAGQALLGLGTGVAALWVVTALVVAAVGHDHKVQIGIGPAALFAATLVAGAALFVAVGAFTSQLAASRRQASAYAGVALGVCYGLRLVADSSHSLGWIRWITPLGWIEQIHPLTSPQPWLFAPVGALVAVLCGATVFCAGRRDVGSGLLRGRTVIAPHVRLLSSPTGLAYRLLRPVILGWVAAIAATGLLMGFIAKQGGTALTSSSSVRNVVSRLGIHGGGAAEYLGFTFLVVAVLVSFVAASQVTSAHAEEAEGHLALLLARPVSRVHWLVSRSLLAVVAVCVSGVAAGTFAWVGAASQHAGVAIAGLLGAGINACAPALCIFGVGVSIYGMWPRLASGAVYGLLVWSLAIELLAGILTSGRWLLDTSVFHQITAAPAAPPDWSTIGVLAAIGVAGVMVGTAAFRRRTVAGG